MYINAVSMHNAHVNVYIIQTKNYIKIEKKKHPSYICGAVYLSISNLQKILKALDAFYFDIYSKHYIIPKIG